LIILNFKVRFDSIFQQYPFYIMPTMPKQFPDTGTTHYTFDPVD
jgi:hypothetical protein